MFMEKCIFSLNTLEMHLEHTTVFYGHLFFLDYKTWLSIFKFKLKH